MLIIGGLWDPHLKGAFDLYKKSKEAGGSSRDNYWECDTSKLVGRITKISIKIF